MNTCSIPLPGRYVEVAPNARLADRRATLTYRVPEALEASTEVGQLIWAPLKKRIVLGIVVERHDREPATEHIRDIHAPVEPTFCLTPLQWRLAVWIAEQTVCTLYEAASVMLPPGVGSRAVEYLSLKRQPLTDEIDTLTPSQKRLVAFLSAEGETTLERAQRAQQSSLRTIVPALEERGIVQRIARVRNRPEPRMTRAEQVRLVPDSMPPPERAHRQVEALAWLTPRLRTRPDLAMPIESIVASSDITRATLRALAARGCIIIEPLTEAAADHSGGSGAPPLTNEQSAAWEQIRPRLDREAAALAILLHGVTGSGKTELYLRAAGTCLASGRSAIVLAPEIGLSSQIAQRFRARFGNRAIILHSALGDSTRAANWQRAGGVDPVVVIGPRSALFAPLHDIGVIILDEEHDSSYKQDSIPRYHTRAVAEELASYHNALLILGSATPDVETFYRSTTAGWQRIELRERVGQRVAAGGGQLIARPIPLPDTVVVDMRAELRSGNESIFSRRLMEVVSQRIMAGEQIMLFLNRRGMSTIVQCRSCGAVTQCPYCDIPLVYHRTSGRVICHRCGHRRLAPARCEVCGSDAIGYFGAGTQRIESEVQRLVPHARVVRWDQDALRGGVTHESLLRRVLNHEVDIIVGTQMIAKGLDLPDVTAVGVINADTYLYLPDIRAAERTFQMVTQVAGRAGRRVSGSEVVLQTFSPEHYAISNAARHDYASFYREEIAFRARHGYPPFKRLARLVIRHTDEDRARGEAEALAGVLEAEILSRPEIQGIDIIGPAPTFSARVRGQYGWQIIIRGGELLALLADLNLHPGWTIDIDPVNLL